MRNSSWAALIIVFGIIGFALMMRTLFITVQTPDGEVVEGNLFNLAEGTNITITGDDGTNTVTIGVTGSGTTIQTPDGEVLEGSLFTFAEGTDIIITGDDGTNTITIGVTGSDIIKKSIAILDPTTGDTNKVQFEYGVAVTITEVSCSTNAGTLTIQLDERTRATVNVSGTDVMTNPLVCDTNTETTTAFSNSGIPADTPVNLQIPNVTTATAVRIHVKALGQ